MKRNYIRPALTAALVTASVVAFFATAASGTKPARQTPEPAPEQTLEYRYDGEVAAQSFRQHTENIIEKQLEADAQQTVRLYGDTDAELLAKIIWAEARGVATTAEKAAVAWCILNRYDDGTYGDSIAAVATAPYQFAYLEGSPVEPELKELALDVLARWQAEKEGATDAGRTLPTDYLFFDGDGVANHFRQEYDRGSKKWDWSITSPYEEDKP